MVNNKKDKKPNLITFAIMLIIIVAIFKSCFGGDSSKDNKDTTTNKQTSKTVSNEVKETSKTNNFDFSNAELTKENINKAIDNIIPKEQNVKIEITKEDNKNIIDIVYASNNTLSEKALVKGFANTATDIIEVLFKNPKVDKVWVWASTEMVDQKGNSKQENVVNVCLTKENVKDINWGNFKPMIQGDYNKLFNIADSHFIHPAIQKVLN